jgi:NAD(P)-dependent dehydrogenase (short-subunit alcohol dehydrogenase family)
MSNRPIALFLFCLVLITAGAAFAQEADQKAILVTGASSGIGRNITERLAAEGYFVYAGARKDADLAELDAIENVQSVRLDVTVDADIQAAVETVKAGGRGLYGLVNNAGVAVVGPLIELTEEDVEFQFDVNVFGPYRVTKAFAPLLIESQGRITTIGSISGTIASPFGGVYSMSKFAVEAYTDALAAEMERFGVEVNVVEPGNYRSSIGLSLRKRMEDQGISAEGSLYAEEMESIMSMPVDRTQYKDPDEVSDAVMRALFDDSPGRRYMVVPAENEARLTITTAFRRLAELNANQAYKYDRETLVEMLDAALAEQDPAPEGEEE